MIPFHKLNHASDSPRPIHRGMSENHARTAVEWYLNTLTEFPHDPWQLAKNHLKTPTPTIKPEPVEEPIGPAEYDTGISAEEGLWTRKGWAGRYQ